MDLINTPYISDDTRGVPLLVVQQDDSDDELDDIENNRMQKQDYTSLIPSSQQNSSSVKNTKNNTNRKKSYYYRDKMSGIIFLCHVFVIFILAVTSGGSFGHSSWGAPSVHQAAVLITSTLLLLCLSGAIGVMWLRLLIRYSSELIGVVLWTMTGACFFISIVYMILVTDGFFTGLLYLLLAVFSFFYALAVQDTIPFASAVLQVACLGLQVNMPGLLVVGIGSMVTTACWVLMWLAAYLGVVGATAAAVGFLRGALAEPLLLLSLYWGIQVCTNIANVTTSGAVAHWWFRPSSLVGNHKRSVDVDLDASVSEGSSNDAVKASLVRATTSSFGSVCLGSFVVAILQTLRSMTRYLRDQVEHHYFRGSLGLALGVQGQRSSNPRVHNCMKGLLTLLDALLSILHRLACVFNRFAFVYVAVYGDDFDTSGRSAYELFRSRGMEAVVGDSLISNVLALGGLVSGAMVGMVGWALGTAAGLKHAQVLLLSLVGVVSGYGMCAVLMHGLVVSSVATVFVCFAHDDVALKNHRPAEHELLSNAWRVAHPDYANTDRGGVANSRPAERLNADVEAEAVREQRAAVVVSEADGDMVEAHYHRSLVKKHQEALVQQNAAAAAAILDPQRLGDGWGVSIDLHGLFVQEAIAATNDFLNFHETEFQSLNRGGSALELNIITGVGNHSVDNKPKIKPAIQDMLEKRQKRQARSSDGFRYHFEPLGGGGGFKVSLSTDPESPVFSGGAAALAMTANSAMFESAAFESQELE